MAVKVNHTKKDLKDRIHDYMMGLSKISPKGITDKNDKYYYHVKYFN